MKGNNLGEFIDDILISGGPEKEFIFRDKYYFLESTYHTDDSIELHIDEYDEGKSNEPKYVRRYSFFGKNLYDCMNKFGLAKIFDGLTIYEAESEIEVLFG